MDVAVRRRRDLHLRRAPRRRQSRRPVRTSTKSSWASSATYRLYRTQDDDWICIAAITDARVPRAVHGARRRRDRRRRTLRDRREPQRAPAPARVDPRAALPRPRPRRSGRARSTTPACPTRCRSTRTAARPRCSTPTTSSSAWSRATRIRCWATSASSVELIDFSETPGRVDGPAAARRPGHARDPARARPQRPRDRRTHRRQRLLRARRPLRRTLLELNATPENPDPDRPRLRMLPPGAHTGFLGNLCVPDDLYWIAREPVALVGMSYPGRADWSLLTRTASATSCACRTTHPLTTPRRAPSPRSVCKTSSVVATRTTPIASSALVERAAADVVAHLERGIGVAVHCMGGRGRTGHRHRRRARDASATIPTTVVELPRPRRQGPRSARLAREPVAGRRRSFGQVTTPAPLPAPSPDQQLGFRAPA